MDDFRRADRHETGHGNRKADGDGDTPQTSRGITVCGVPQAAGHALGQYTAGVEAFRGCALARTVKRGQRRLPPTPALRPPAQKVPRGGAVLRHAVADDPSLL